MPDKTETDALIVAQTKTRLKRMNINVNSLDAVILSLAKEINYYRAKIQSMEEFYNADRKTR